MKKDASKLITEDQFWQIIEMSDKGQNLERELNKLTEEEIFGFRYWFISLHHKSYNQALWAVAYIVLGGCSDDGFDYFRYWLLSRGRDVFYAAMENPDSLCDEFDDLPDEEYPEQEDIAYVPNLVIQKKFGKDFYKEEEAYDFHLESYPEIEFEWDEDDEDSMRKVCPNTFDKWWDNDVF